MRRPKDDVDSTTSKNEQQSSQQSSRKKKSKKYLNGGKSPKSFPLVEMRNLGSGGNDSRWYTNIPYLAKDAANVSFNVSAGIPQIQGLTSGGAIGEFGYYSASCYTPGVMSFRIAPVLGGSNLTPQSAPNIAAQQIYTIVRRANSSLAAYDKTDLMLMILAVDNAYMLYQHLCRAYKIANTYDPLNRYLPRTLMQSVGVNLSLIVDNMADFRALLDHFAYMLSSVAIPDEFDLLRRHEWLFSHVYKDSENPRANFMVFVPQLLYRWTEGVGDEPNSLTCFNPLETLKSATALGQIDALISQIMEPLLGSQAVGNMCAEIMKAFPNGLFKPTLLAENSTIIPEYNREVMSQIENMTIYDVKSFNRANNGTAGRAHINMSNWDITQNLTDLVSGPYLTQGLDIDTPTIRGNDNRCFGFKPGLNMHWDHPTSDDVLVATRLTAVDTYPGPSFEIDICGTEVCLGASVYTMGDFNLPSDTLTPSTADMNALSEIQFGSVLQTTTNAVGGTANIFQTIYLVESFDWHPALYLYAWSDSTESTQPDESAFIGALLDKDNYKVLELEDLKAIHDAAILSLYAAKSYTR